MWVIFCECFFWCETLFEVCKGPSCSWAVADGADCLRAAAAWCSRQVWLHSRESGFLEETIWRVWGSGTANKKAFGEAKKNKWRGRAVHQKNRQQKKPSSWLADRSRSGTHHQNSRRGIFSTSHDSHFTTLGVEPHYSANAIRSLQTKCQKRVFKKNAAYLAHIREPWRVVVEDESIFVYEVKLRKVWAKKGSKPAILTTGSHRRTVWFGALADDGTQLFRQKPNADTENFLLYMDELRAKYPYMILFLDRATWHKKDERAKAYFRKHCKTIRVRWFPPAFPEANALEECWRQGKNTCLGSTFYQTFPEFKKATSQYYRTKRFKLDLYKYLCH